MGFYGLVLGVVALFIWVLLFFFKLYQVAVVQEALSNAEYAQRIASFKNSSINCAQERYAS